MPGAAYILFDDVPLDSFGEDGPQTPRVTWQTVFYLFGGQDRFMRRMLTRRAFRRWRGKSRKT